MSNDEKEEVPRARRKAKYVYDVHGEYETVCIGEKPDVFAFLLSINATEKSVCRLGLALEKVGVSVSQPRIGEATGTRVVGPVTAQKFLTHWCAQAHKLVRPENKTFLLFISAHGGIDDEDLGFPDLQFASDVKGGEFTNDQDDGFYSKYVPLYPFFKTFVGMPGRKVAMFSICRGSNKVEQNIHLVPCAKGVATFFDCAPGELSSAQPERFLRQLVSTQHDCGLTIRDMLENVAKNVEKQRKNHTPQWFLDVSLNETFFLPPKMITIRVAKGPRTRTLEGSTTVHTLSKQRHSLHLCHDCVHIVGKDTFQSMLGKFDVKVVSLCHDCGDTYVY